MEVSVLGAGSWGTALACHLKRSGHNVTIWGNENAVLDDISRGKNEKYFPGLPLEDGIKPSASLTEAEVYVIAVPSVAVREVCRRLLSDIKRIAPSVLVCAAKGLESGTLKRMSEVISEETGFEAVILSGPSFAREVIEGKPTAVTIASRDENFLKVAQSCFHHGKFRVYPSNDVIGVELGGTVKNVIALASGIIDGEALGLNARAALLTRGLAEMQRLALALGAQSDTLWGLSGLGDLLLTATGDLSRNRRVGLALGQGKKLKEALEEIGQVAEGVEAAPVVLALARRHAVEVPITEEVVQILAGKSTVEDSTERLFARDSRPTE